MYSSAHLIMLCIYQIHFIVLLNLYFTPAGYTTISDNTWVGDWFCWLWIHEPTEVYCCTVC